MKSDRSVLRVFLRVVARAKLLSLSIVLVVVGAVIAAVLPPLYLEIIVNHLTEGIALSLDLVACYIGLQALAGLLESTRESLLTVFGQKIAHGLRQALCAKLSRLPAEDFVKQEPGVIASRFVGDVDTVESLFTSGIISMFADACKIVTIFAVIFVKNRGLALTLLLLMPLVFGFTRVIQKRMLAAQLANRIALGRASGHVPETIRCIRMIHTFQKEKYMRQKYDEVIEESYAAVDRTNFYDSIYSPVILLLNAIVVAAVMLLSASGNPAIETFFGMSVGTAVAVIAYISQVFSPIENIGMEIQTIQSAVAGVRRISEFLNLHERWETDRSIEPENLVSRETACMEFRNVTFGYGEQETVLKNLSFSIATGEQVTLTGRTGAGKSTAFKLLLGLYQPEQGEVLIFGKDAALLPDSLKRRIFGYVEQSFHMVPGTVLDQITLFDDSITVEQAVSAAKLVGLHPSIEQLEHGYDTPCAPSLFSQGQWQLLSIARAIAAEPLILLLDEITANLDAETEQLVLTALQNASANRTVLSISHRLYEQAGGRQIAIG